MVEVTGLRLFEDFSAADQTRMQADVNSQLAVEYAWLDPAEVITDAADVSRRINQFELVAPDLTIDHFGIVSPIRIRRPDLSDAVEIQSYPYVTSDTHDFLLSLMDRLYDAVIDERAAFSVDDIAFSVTSLLRTLRYQEYIAQKGKLACEPKPGVNSTHNEGRAFDVDHGGGYVFVNGTWQTAHPRGNFELWQPIRRVMRGVFAEVAGTMPAHNVIDEVPTGWGTYHVAVKPIIENKGE